MNSCAIARGWLRAAALLSGVFLGACDYHVKATLLDPRTRRPPTCVAAISVFEAPAEVNAAYSGVARISLWAPPDAKVTPESDILALRKKAAELGANGLILGYRREQLHPKGQSSIAIYIPSDSARVRMACDSAGQN
jgi:hypothetical protein